MNYRFVLPLFIKTSYRDEDNALKEVKTLFETQSKYDKEKIAVSKTVALLARRKDGPENDPTTFKFFFLSNDKEELQKMADDYNQKLYGSDSKKIDILGARVSKNRNLGNFTA